MLRKILILSFLLLFISCAKSPAEAPKQPSDKKELTKIVKEKSEEPTPIFSLDSPKTINWGSVNKASILDALMSFKIVMVYIYTNDCDKCILYEMQTLNDKNILPIINDRFLPIKLNESDERSKQYLEFLDNPPEYPVTMFFTPTGDYVAAINGYLPPSVFHDLIKQLTDVLDNVKRQHEARETISAP